MPFSLSCFTLLQRQASPFRRVILTWFLCTAFCSNILDLLSGEYFGGETDQNTLAQTSLQQPGTGRGGARVEYTGPKRYFFVNMVWKGYPGRVCKRCETEMSCSL